MREPTGDECNSNMVVTFNEVDCHACWYPQMGGYVGKCWVVPQNSGCFRVYVWHDGNFPFTDEDDDRTVATIHHCNADQFIDFGNFVKTLPGMMEE